MCKAAFPVSYGGRGAGRYSQGETVDKAPANIREAIVLAIEELRELGRAACSS